TSPSPAPWSIAQYVDDDGTHLGILAGDVMHAVPSGWPATSAELFDRWGEWRGALVDLDPSDLVVVPGATLAAPITYPRKLICAGANY
ncbi:hypothetical protein NL296_27655, partial [Klebsiella pneumoniae]|nr:hypothetical protein [Klebsiella pneumoniae]